MRSTGKLSAADFTDNDDDDDDDDDDDVDDDDDDDDVLVTAVVEVSKFSALCSNNISNRPTHRRTNVKK